MPSDTRDGARWTGNGPVVLVTGGAGFVGSHTCKALAGAGFRPVVYDNLSNGARQAVQWGPLEVGDLDDAERLAAVVAAYAPKGVLHFAGRIEAGASVTDPAAFYDANVAATLTLLRVMRAAGLDAIVFSSTAAVYGDPDVLPIPETHPLHPVNPYGRTKRMAEEILADLHTAEGLRYAALRYFNAAGADPDGDLWETHQPETHLIPLTVQAALGLRPEIAVFGTDYDTPDGTCVRDYVHVADLAQAHVLALGRLLGGGAPLVANLGTGRGHSVREVVATVERVTGRPVPTRIAPRRPGDPPTLVAAPDTAIAELGWRPIHAALEAQVRDSVRGERRRAGLQAPDDGGPLSASGSAPP
ncbi:UDP-glucose 4-epimerase GalE [Roseospira marina]|uniref:UDP-glucose 4-epimerase n=1 Tax=Roseospira marina TaxID=140057 RepID=A0A5M6I998_9PROT|nr:UDP-glucose 4-epimerase GalE [Roseospira marina]KAA5604248.1 UDP-glucose 4-epimerase GalE [Roseospira marina]MBB4315605.1 UDP-glucose-4-epimerase GalE [Roseospira marina]MBB5088601.1 UDP-glucose-4-epimerase GalE [Roseospira marina]